jgi:hypothetical protein
MMDPISSIVLGGLLTLGLVFIASIDEPRTSLSLEADRLFIYRRRALEWDTKMKRITPR